MLFLLLAEKQNRLAVHCIVALKQEIAVETRTHIKWMERFTFQKVAPVKMLTNKLNKKKS